MKIRQLYVAVLAAGLSAMAPAAWGQQASVQDKPEARQQAKAGVNGESSTAARKASALQAPKKGGEPATQPDRREKAMQVSGGLQKKTSETANAAASNMK
ncbi:hypothetical protein SAMN05518865_12511 [Duganella sp. CF458]|uniref:hypothetical protein n=1 Tax=Duganella sp. CF458 TaxID=1884368 RepID=UPI0008E99D0C|nr:hypothetical protein [Duganella sp. CF458]SFG95828.1 hypothetical protein SAMN05518865_12511 [Duganella sp. CF458]